MKKVKAYFKKAKIFFGKLYTRFLNYKNTKKWFVLYLAILALCLFVLFPVVKVDRNGVWFLFSWMLWKSGLVMLLAMVGLFLWNLSISFKGWITKLCALREDEPLVDFVLLWIIVSVFMWVMDWANIVNVQAITTRVSLSSLWIIVNWLLLLWWLVWSFISLRKMWQKSNKRTRIVNIVEENRQRPESQKSNQVTHLFDNLDDEN